MHGGGKSKTWRFYSGHSTVHPGKRNNGSKDIPDEWRFYPDIRRNIAFVDRVPWVLRYSRRVFVSLLVCEICHSTAVCYYIITICAPLVVLIHEYVSQVSQSVLVCLSTTGWILWFCSRRRAWKKSAISWSPLRIVLTCCGSVSLFSSPRLVHLNYFEMSM